MLQIRSSIVYVEHGLEIQILTEAPKEHCCMNQVVCNATGDSGVADKSVKV